VLLLFHVGLRTKWRSDLNFDVGSVA
jgi:hypothetical protein